MAIGEFVEFKCPECGENTLEEVSRGTLYNTINGFYQGWPEYDSDENSDNTEVVRYQCFDCGKTLIEGYSTNLYEKCKRNGWLDLPVEDTPDWEV